jgi:NAD(P)-dependent dehydrogenase (short-subunit alcohol dehydrogenase family)
MIEQQSILTRLFSLEGKVALVTGASGGIGGVLAVALAEAGATVVVQGRRVEELEKVRREIEQRGGTATVLAADLGDATACKDVIAKTIARLGRLDVLVNCAGMNRRKTIADVTEDDFDTIMNVNLRSVFVLCHEARAAMRKQGGGKIINVGSITSTYGLGGVSVYGISKSAMAGYTAALAAEFAPDNIQVNCLAPGFILTPLTEKPIWQDPVRSKWLLDHIPAKRPGTPDDLVGTALFLASPASNYLTGQLITVDGGFLAAVEAGGDMPAGA